MAEYEAELRQVFQAYARQCGGPARGDQAVTWAPPSAMSRVVLDCFPGMLTIHDAIVFPWCADRATRKLHVDAFCRDWFLKLAQQRLQEGERRRVDHREPQVQYLARLLKARVAALAHQPRKEAPKAMSIVRRLTDHRLFTGVQKLRFDAEGKGLGKDGSGDRSTATGYVQNYRGAGTFTYNRLLPRHSWSAPRPPLQPW